MQGQPPPTGRPWFRLASMSLMESPPQPTFSQALAPPPPPPPPSQPSNGGSPPSVVESSPPPSPNIIKHATLMATQAPIPEPESKSMLAPQPEPISTQHSTYIDSHNNNIKKSKEDEEAYKYNNNNETKLKYTKKESDTKWGTITIKGDNMGVYMDLLAVSQNKKQSNNNNNNMLKKEASSSDKPMTGHVNSNVQAINNSMVLNHVFAHKNPGVHLKLFSRCRPMSSGNIRRLKD